MWRLAVLALIASVTATPVYVVRNGVVIHEAELNNALASNFESRVNNKLRESCNRYGSIDSYDNFVTAKEECTRQISGGLMQEVGKAMANRENLDTPRALCRIKPQLNSCMANLTKSIAACAEPERRGRADTVVKAAGAFLEYICYNDGERITTFIEEGGRECLGSKKDDLEQCVSSSVYNNKPNPTEDNEVEEYPVLAQQSEAEECREAIDLQKCIVGHLKQCDKPAASNIVDGLFTSVINATPCQRYKNN